MEGRAQLPENIRPPPRELGPQLKRSRTEVRPGWIMMRVDGKQLGKTLPVGTASLGEIHHARTWARLLAGSILINVLIGD